MSNLSRVQVGEIEIAVDDRGDGERPFLLVHGYTGSRDDFADVHDALAEEGRTLTMDQRGHGDSTNLGDQGGYGLEIQAADVIGLLDALGLDQVDLLGHSLGGMVALRCVLNAPERFSSLVLMDTSPQPLTLMPLAVMQAGAKLGKEQGMDRLAEIMRAAPEEGKSEALLRSIQEMGPERYWARARKKIEAMDPDAMHTLAGVLADHPSVVDRLGEINCPTLVMVGEQDAPFLEPSRIMGEGIKDSRQCVIPKAAHSPQIENEAAWLEAIRGHLRTVRA